MSGGRCPCQVREQQFRLFRVDASSSRVRRTRQKEAECLYCSTAEPVNLWVGTVEFHRRAHASRQSFLRYRRQSQTVSAWLSGTDRRLLLSFRRHVGLAKGSWSGPQSGVTARRRFIHGGKVPAEAWSRERRMFLGSRSTSRRASCSGRRGTRGLDATDKGWSVRGAHPSSPIRMAKNRFLQDAR